MNEDVEYRPFRDDPHGLSLQLANGRTSLLIDVGARRDLLGIPMQAGRSRYLPVGSIIWGDEPSSKVWTYAGKPVSNIFHGDDCVDLAVQWVADNYECPPPDSPLERNRRWFDRLAGILVLTRERHHFRGLGLF